MRTGRFLFVAGVAAVALVSQVRAEDWVDFNGNRMAQKYSAAAQIKIGEHTSELQSPC